MKKEQENRKSPTALLRTAVLLAIVTAGLCACIRAITSAAQQPLPIVQNAIAIAPVTESGDWGRQKADRDV